MTWGLGTPVGCCRDRAESGQHGGVTLQGGAPEPTEQGPVALTLDGLSLQIAAQQIAAQGQPQKVTYATQPALKTQFLTTPISQAQKLAGTQQVQTQIQVSVNQRKGQMADPTGTQDRSGQHAGSRQ